MTDRDKKGGIVVGVGTAMVQIGPVGFILYAEEFLEAGSAIPEHSQARGSPRFTPVPFYLFCRALELALKAFLLAKNRPLDELKAVYGHDLEALWRAAKNMGSLDVLGAREPHFESDLCDANQYYKGKAFEYFDFRRWACGYEDLPPLSRFKVQTREIVEKMKQYCFSLT